MSVLGAPTAITLPSPEIATAVPMPASSTVVTEGDPAVTEAPLQKSSIAPLPTSTSAQSAGTLGSPDWAPAVVGRAKT